jgi:hypothetical protein
MGVVGGETTLGALIFQKSCKVSAGVFSAAVRPTAHDAIRTLDFHPGHDCFVGIEGFILGG